MRINKKLKHIGRTIITIALVSSMSVTPVFATPSSSDLKEEQDELQQEADDLSSQLNKLMAEIATTKKNIEYTQKALVEAGEALEQAEVDEYEQYEAMKLRIRYIYEESSSNETVERIINAKSIVDMLNQASYVNEVHNYDRDMLAKYVEAKEAVIEMHTVYEDKIFQLQESEDTLVAKQEGVANLLSSKQDEIDAMDDAIKEAIEKEAAAAAAAAAARVAAARAAAEAAAQAAAQAEGNSSSSNNSSSNVTASGTGTGLDIANYALKFVGNKYVYGGTSLTNGADCSGFTQAVYASFGYSIPRTSYAQRSAGVGVSYSNAQAGDIICYSGHVAIYIGNGKIVHASNSRAYPSGGIKTDNATYNTILAVRRIIN